MNNTGSENVGTEQLLHSSGKHVTFKGQRHPSFRNRRDSLDRRRRYIQDRARRRIHGYPEGRRRRRYRSDDYLSRCGKWVKFFFLCLNLVLFLVGIMALMVGLFLWFDFSFAYRLTNVPISRIGVVTTIVICACCVCLVAFIGYYGISHHSLNLVLYYTVIVFLLCVALCSSGLYGSVRFQELKSHLKSDLLSSMQLYGKDTKVKTAWDSVQQKFKCCGVNNYEDWNDDIPESCCSINEDEEDCNIKNGKAKIYKKGCYEVIDKLSRKHGKVLGIALLFACIYLLVCGILGAILLKMMLQ